MVVQRTLGWLNLLDATRPYGIKYVLDLNNDEELQVAKRLVKLATKIRSLEPCLSELMVSGN